MSGISVTKLNDVWWLENIPRADSDCISLTSCMTPSQKHKLLNGIPMSIGTPFRGAQELSRSPLVTPGQPAQLKLDFSKNSDVSCDDNIMEPISKEISNSNVGKSKETKGAKQHQINYPTPGKLLHPGWQMPQTPVPGILPALPSQRFYYKECDTGLKRPVVCDSDFLMPAKPKTTQCDEQKTANVNKCKPTNMLTKFTENISINTIPTGRQLPRTPPDVPGSEEMPPSAIDHTARTDGRENILPLQAACETHQNLALESQVELVNEVASEETHMLNDANMSKSIVDEIVDDSHHAVSNRNKENIFSFAVECLNKSSPSNKLEDQTTNKQINANAKDINRSLPLRTGVMEVGYMVKQLGGYEQSTPDLIFLQHKRQMYLLRELQEKHHSRTQQHKILVQNKEYLLASVEKVQQDEEEITKNVMSTVQQALELQGSCRHSVTDLADVLAALPSLDVRLLRQRQQLQAAKGKQLLLEVERCTAQLLTHKSHLELAVREKEDEYQREVIEASGKLQQEEEEVKKLQAIVEKQKQNIKAMESKTSELHRLLQKDLSRSEGDAHGAAESHTAQKQRDPERRAQARLHRLKQRKKCAERRQKMISAIFAKPLHLTYSQY